MSSLQGTLYTALGLLLKTSFQRICFKAMRTLQHPRLWPSHLLNEPPNMARSRSTDHPKTVRLHPTCTLREGAGKFRTVPFGKPSGAKHLLPSQREALLRCCCNGMENVWRRGCKKWCGNPQAYNLQRIPALDFLQPTF